MEFIETTKGGRKLSKDGLLYIKNKMLTNERTYWECAQRCRGNGCNVKTTLDAADRFVAQTHQHSHGAHPEGNDLLKARAGMKRSAKDTAEKTQNIITANIAGLQENVLAQLPNIETIRRDARRNRPNNHPTVPDIYDTQFAIPQNYTVDVLGQQFIVYDNGRPDRILLFGTDEGFRFLSNSQDWFLEETFKSSPVQFMQLYTVHGLTNHQNIVGAYALLPNKRRATYVEMLTKVQRLTHNAMPHSLMTDFESSMLSALNQIYPGIPQVGCLFHLAKNVFRRVQHIGLQQNYLKDPLFRGNIRMIPALSFVPVQDVILAFNEACNHCGIDEQPVLDCFETNYIGDLRRGRRLLPLFPHELWNMHNQVLNEFPRTNNNLEGWHTRFSTMFRQTHPSIWEFIDTLKLNASHNRMLIAQVLAGAPPPSQKRVYRDVSARIATLVQVYNNGNIIPFLRGICYNIAAQ